MSDAVRPSQLSRDNMEVGTSLITEPDIQSFFDTAAALVAAADKIDAEFARRLGSRFNLFDCFIGHDENRISDILRELLDPRGSHGQGDGFLRTFLQLCKIRESWTSELSTVSVYREYRTLSIGRARKIDLVIDFGAGAVGIENKPWAGDQDHQVSDYDKELQRRFPRRNHLVYLSGDGSDPKSHDGWKRLARGHTIAYSGPTSAPGEVCTLRDWVDQCGRLAEADKIRWFLADFADWLARNFKDMYQEESGAMNNR